MLYHGRLYTHATDWGSPFLGSVFDAASGSLVQRVRLDEVPRVQRPHRGFPFRADQIATRSPRASGCATADGCGAPPHVRSGLIPAHRIGRRRRFVRREIEGWLLAS